MKRIEVSEQIVRLFEKQQDELGYPNLTAFMNDLAREALGKEGIENKDLTNLFDQVVAPILDTYSQTSVVDKEKMLVMSWPMNLVKHADGRDKSLIYQLHMCYKNRLIIEQHIKFEGYTTKKDAKIYLRNLATHLDGFSYKEYTNDTFVYRRYLPNHYKDAYYGCDIEAIAMMLQEEIIQTIERLNTYHRNP